MIPMQKSWSPALDLHKVEDKKEIFFTYDVEFEVSYHNPKQLNYQSATKNWISVLIYFLTLWNFYLSGEYCEVAILLGYLSSNGRWPDSLVFNCQFFNDCTFPFGHGGYDNVEDTLSWYLQVQSTRDTRSSSRRDGGNLSMGMFSGLIKLRLNLCICWNRCSVLLISTCLCWWLFVGFRKPAIEDPVKTN